MCVEEGLISLTAIFFQTGQACGEGLVSPCYLPVVLKLHAELDASGGSYGREQVNRIVEEATMQGLYKPELGCSQVPSNSLLQ